MMTWMTAFSDVVLFALMVRSFEQMCVLVHRARDLARVAVDAPIASESEKLMVTGQLILVPVSTRSYREGWLARW